MPQSENLWIITLRVQRSNKFGSVVVETPDEIRALCVDESRQNFWKFSLKSKLTKYLGQNSQI